MSKKTTSLLNLESEADFQARVIRAARLHGWSVYAIPDSRRATLAGYPDLTMYRRLDRRIIFAELKREKGKTSPVQDEVLADLRDIALGGGCEVYVWRPSDWEAILSTLKHKGIKASKN